MTLAGSGFTSSTSVALNGVSESTTYVSSAQVTAVLPASQLATAASLTLAASNGTAASAPVGFTINNPPPVVSLLSVTSIAAGSASSTVTVTGTGFVPTSSVLVNGAARTTTYSSGTRLSFTLNSTDVSATGTLAVTVSNASPGGGASAAANIQVIPPTPSIASLAPASVLAGSSDSVVTLTGSGFTSSASVSVNGSAVATSYVSATQVKITLPAAQLTSAATLAITATNGGGSGVSAAVSFSVNNPAPTLTALSTSSLVAGSTPAAITLTGSGFLSTSTILVNGSARTTTLVSATQLSFTPTAADIALPGALAVSVSNAAPGGGTSAMLNIAVTAATPTITSISPNSVAAGASDTTVTITGTNFLPSSLVMTGSTALSTTYVSGTQLTAIVPAANLASLGWLPLNVHTPSASAISGTVTLPVVTKLQLNANRMVYDSYNRKLWVTTGAASSTIAGNSLVSIDPATGTVGTQVTLSSTAYAIALSDSGKTLYALSATLLYRYDTTSGTLTSATIPGVSGSSSVTTTSLAIAPGSENQVVFAISTLGNYQIQVYDFDPVASAVSARAGSVSLPSHYGLCPDFLDGYTLINPYNTLATINLYPVTTSGLGSSSATYSSNATSETTGCIKTVGATGYGSTGNVYAFAQTAITKTATINLPAASVLSFRGSPVSPDLSLHQVFFGTIAGGNGPSSLTSASTDTNTVNTAVILPGSSVTSTGTYYYSDDLFRWGQDGLALLVRDDLGSGGAILYLLRGPFVVPQELNTNPAATLSAASPATITAGSGNTMLTLTGSNFVPGVAVTWNGSYRTTTIVDSTHLTISLPASDVAAAGSATLIATNPGASASSSITVTVQ